MSLLGTGNPAYILPRLWHKLICRTFGIKIVVQGTPHTQSQTVFVGNHLSYLDIPVIGSVLKTSFVSKKEVANWPVFGYLAKLQQTGFIDRSRSAALNERSAIGAMMREGKNLVIFPEGTSTDGREVLPFKSSLFSLMLQDEQPGLIIQPFTIRMELVDGQVPETQDTRDIYSWHRDMDTELPVHLWRFAFSRGAVITLAFHTPFAANSYSDRKELAKICQKQVALGLAENDNHRNLSPIQTTATLEGAKKNVQA
ncbi:MAG: 1-acyl-sn-glycerol-3-phosphate acyltransferase [Alphaproteobacteria bacterium]|nr:1-acyl-sn-glycerol-3-phosphate acyltransferase [Alphaproteobacteria bacterium]MCD8570923.1 1-acyl-sn-glycerol-3-phosphate acyltransferase [Alphaproteobacteria bacterium]